eukprot:maker-scaffold927_size80360-snap-gene-0.21 protein:Tk12217 transcript:maker-scaffold927_size80360-snap-gene-0.21-mRNA-1 annotation:"atp-binding cassette sub-family a member 7"
MRHLTKVYTTLKNQSKTVVNDLSLDFLDGEVTVLLGHNGAGKSTTIKMLTGLETMTSGEIEICGYSYPSQWTQIQSKIGFCPQNSILFPDLSTREHLSFYGQLKGLDGVDELNEAVEELLQAMHMVAAQHEPVKTLSEGNQRRVCVSLALIGGSKVVILDEPTAGVDPIARRYIWDLISRYKKGRTILMTTHHMDEAEILSDRIAIIHQGHLLTQGKLKDLKEEYGGGLKLVIEKNEQTGPRSRTGSVEHHLNRLLPTATKEEEDHRHVKYFIPNQDPHHAGGLIEFMAILENEGSSLGVAQYHTEATTLEDIFLSLVTESNPGKLAGPTDKLKLKVMPHNDLPLNGLSEGPPTTTNPNSDTSSVVSSSVFSEMDLRTGWPLVLSQIRGLLYKRFKHGCRDWRFWMTCLFLPTLLMICTMCLALLRPNTEHPSLLMSPSLYGESSYSFVRFEPDSPLNSVLETLTRNPGIGTTCMADFPSDVGGMWTSCRPELGERNFSTLYEV